MGNVALFCLRFTLISLFAWFISLQFVTQRYTSMATFFGDSLQVLLFTQMGEKHFGTLSVYFT